MITSVKLNPAELLSRLASSKSSGCLELDDELVSWKIYLEQGNLKYTSCSIQLLDQLKYYLHYLQLKQVAASLKQIPQSLLQDKSLTTTLYSRVISWLFAEKHLDQSQGLKLIQHIAKDSFQSCLLLNKGSSTWHDEHSLPIWIPQQITASLSVSVAKSLKEGQTKLKQLQNCSTELISIYQCPYFSPSWKTKPLPNSGSLNQEILSELAKILSGRTSIRQLSILLKKDEFQVAQILSPYIDSKIIYLHHASAPLDRLPTISRLPQQVNSLPPIAPRITHQKNTGIKTWKIVCIDDSPTILNEMKRFLDSKKFEITAIDDPVQAASKIFTINPDLILLDITMPRINGYKLCGLLRSSGRCDHTPIVMVTGNTGLIDKARAKISGATDYLAKPFTKEGLNKIAIKHLQ